MELRSIGSILPIREIGIQIGQKVQVEVLSVGQNGKAQIRLAGQEISAFLEIPIQKGEKFLASVQTLDDRGVLLVREKGIKQQEQLPMYKSSNERINLLRGNFEERVITQLLKQILSLGGTTVSRGTPVPQGTSTQQGTPIPQGTSTQQGTPIPQGTSTSQGTPIPQGTSTSQGTLTPQGMQTQQGTPIPQGTSTSQGTPIPQGTSTSQGTPIPQGTPTPQGKLTPQGMQTPQGTQVPQGMPVPQDTPTLQEAVSLQGKNLSQGSTIKNGIATFVQENIPQWSMLAENDGYKYLTQVIKSMGLDYERRIRGLLNLPQEEQLKEQAEITKTLKGTFLALLENETGGDNRSLLSHLLDRLTGQQLWQQGGNQENPFYLLEFPLRYDNELLPQRLAIKAARKGNKVDLGHCRLALHAQTPTLGELGVEGWLYEGQLSLKALTEDPELISNLIEVYFQSLQQKFSALGIVLHPIGVDNLHKAEEFHRFLRGESREGVDLQV